MITRTVTQREGELLGPIYWNYNFRRHFDTYGSNDAVRDEACDRCKAHLLTIEKSPGEWRVMLAHSFVDRRVLQVGMYDGWPYWKPTPALLTEGTLGPEWHFFYDIVGVKRGA